MVGWIHLQAKSIKAILLIGIRKKVIPDMWQTSQIMMITNWRKIINFINSDNQMLIILTFDPWFDRSKKQSKRNEFSVTCIPMDILINIFMKKKINLEWLNCAFIQTL